MQGNAGLKSRSFLGFLSAQFLGAVNDNIFRWLAVPIAKAGVKSESIPFVLAAGLACFVVPYILLAPAAGFLADRFPKRSVLIGCKWAEIAIMAAGLGVIVVGNVPAMFVVIFLMGAQSAVFAPAKLGIIPEIVDRNQLANANGLVGMTTVVAVVLGTVVGGLLFLQLDLETLENLWMVAAVLLGVAGLGLVSCFPIGRSPAGQPERPIPWNPIRETVNDLRLLGRDVTILRVSWGIAFFWSVASLAQLNVDTFVLTRLHGDQGDVSWLLGALSLGVGAGSVLAGVISGGRIELGLVPLGAGMIAVSSILLASVETSFAVAALLLILMGIGGGLFHVPLTAFLQERSPRSSLGSILAAGNFLTFCGMLLVSFGFVGLQSVLDLDSGEVFLVAGLLTMPVLAYVVLLIPQATIRFFLWMISQLVYRVRVRGREHIPEQGGALLVANHVTWIDGILLLLSSTRPIRMIAYADYVERPVIRWLTTLFRVIPIKGGSGPKAILRALKTAREAVADGDLVCIFPEGALTRSGQMQGFQRGVLRIAEGLDAPVIPVYLDELWGSIFSYRGGRFLWKRPQKWPYPVSINFGEPLHHPENIQQLKQAVQDLGVKSVQERKERQLTPPRQFLRQCKASLRRFKLSDSSGAEVTGGKLLTGALAFRRLLHDRVLGADENMVGVLLPPSVGGAIVNAALALDRRVAVNLNYTLTDDVVNFCIRECGIKHVLTSRRFLEKRPIRLDCEVVFVEDLKEQIGTLLKLRSLLTAFLAPVAMIESSLKLSEIRPDDLLTVIFTSGSTGEPKGVMLSHNNVMSNIEAVDQVFHLRNDDVLVGILPFFHSFGYTGTLWLPLTLGPGCAYHFNPLDAKTVGKLAEKYGASIIMSTPTFLRTYLKRCTPEQFHRLDLVIVGAEKLPMELAEQFEKRFGVVPTEGYGTTELSPVVAFNVPAHRTGNHGQVTSKLGTVGRIIPGGSARVINPDTGEVLGIGEEGLLQISGPNVMLGYLNHPEKTASVVQDGWYNTGDFARIDEDGFIAITGRQSRFSKIGGEMVPHILVEEHLLKALPVQDDEEPSIPLAVTAVPDERKGERLIVVHKPLGCSVDHVLKQLSDCGLPNLWLPGSDSFLEVAEIPLLGTGKLDLKHLKQLALDHFCPDGADS